MCISEEPQCTAKLVGLRLKVQPNARDAEICLGRFELKVLLLSDLVGLGSSSDDMGTTCHTVCSQSLCPSPGGCYSTETS